MKHLDLVYQGDESTPNEYIGGHNGDPELLIRYHTSTGDLDIQTIDRDTDEVLEWNECNVNFDEFVKVYKMLNFDEFIEGLDSGSIGRQIKDKKH